MKLLLKNGAKLNEWSHHGDICSYSYGPQSMTAFQYMLENSACRLNIIRHHGPPAQPWAKDSIAGFLDYGTVVSCKSDNDRRRKSYYGGYTLFGSPYFVEEHKALIRTCKPNRKHPIQTMTTTPTVIDSSANSRAENDGDLVMRRELLLQRLR